MKHLLSLPVPELLATFLNARELLAFDFDGTLAPIASNRDKAALRPSTERLFSELCRAATCAVISGRGREDLEQRLGSAKVRYLVGNHGLELEDGTPATDESIGAARSCLAVLVQRMPGVDLEDKKHSLSLHYRAAPDPSSAHAALVAAVSELRGVRVIPGKRVLNLVPAGGRNKGDALAAIMRRHGAHGALYVGDDVTDEDAFEHEIAPRLVSVRVGRAKLSGARFYLQGQWEIDHLLEGLLGLARTDWR